MKENTVWFKIQLKLASSGLSQDNQSIMKRTVFSHRKLTNQIWFLWYFVLGNWGRRNITMFLGSTLWDQVLCFLGQGPFLVSHHKSLIIKIISENQRLSLNQRVVLMGHNNRGSCQTDYIAIEINTLDKVVFIHLNQKKKLLIFSLSSNLKNIFLHYDTVWCYSAG